LLGVCGLVLLAACFNLGNVLLGRAVLRRHEFAVRRALGISQGRLVRLLATETTLVGLMAAAVGLGVGVVVAKALAALPQFYLGLATLTTPFDSSASLDLRFFGSTLTLGVLLSLLFGLVPLLLHLRRQPLEGLRGRSSRWRLAQLRFPARQGILALQIALSVALAITAGLYARSFLEATRVTTPYDAPESLLVARLRPGGMNAETREAFFASLEDRLERHPEVIASAMASSPPYQAGINVVRHPDSDVRVPIQHKLVESDYFVTTGIPIVEGRGFEGTEAEVTSGILVNRELAARLWPGESPLGRTLVFGEEVRQVQGVVGDEHCADLHAAAYPCAWRLSAPNATTGYVYVRTTGDPMVFAGTLRQMVRELTPDVAVSDEAGLDTYLARLLQPERVSAALTGLLALLGVVLMAIGSAALFLSMVRERRRELSIRMALGATGGVIARAVLGRGAVVLGLGSAIGLAVAYAVSKQLADQLVGIAPTDAIAFVVVPLVVGATGLGAVGIAARTAARTSPSRHLASE
jgi:predicted permease